MNKAVDKTQTEASGAGLRSRHHSEQGDQKRQQIVDKAGELFARFGFKKCTTEDIASACNLTKAALYHYFDNKEAIFAAVIELEAGALLRRLREEIESEPDPVAKVLKYAQTRFDTIKALANLYGFTQVQRPLQPQFEEALQRFQEDELSLVQGILDSGVASGCFRNMNTNQVARVLLAGSKGVMLEYVLNEETETVRTAMTDMARIVCFGLVHR